MTNQITTLSRERLEAMVKDDHAQYGDVAEMASALLAVMDAQEKPRGWLTWHAIPPTMSDPGGGGEYLEFHVTKPAICCDDGTPPWAVFDVPPSAGVPAAYRYRFVKPAETDFEGNPWVGDWKYCNAEDSQSVNRSAGYEVQELFAAPAPSAPDGWINCSDRMPSKESAVLVSHSCGEVWCAVRTSHGWDDGLGGDQDDVTHWMPIPAAPEQ